MEFSFAQFEPLVGTDFTFHTSHGQFALTLAAARALPRRGLPDRFRTPFSLVFDGPPGVVLGRDNYLIGHAAIGQHTLYVMPIVPAHGAPAGPVQYQVVFA